MNRLNGLAAMVVASLLFSLMNVSVYTIAIMEPAIPASFISFMRVSVNLLIIVLPAWAAKNTLELFGDCRLSLWLRGIFGTLALMLSFHSIARIGPGESSVLTNSSGFFVVLLSPLILGQRNSWLVWLAIIGSLAGVSLLFDVQGNSDDLMGRVMALSSGFLSALAYLMVARAGSSNSTRSVVFYFCLVAVFIHLFYFVYAGYQLPSRLETWGMLLLAGCAGSGAQFCMTRAYQGAPAALVSAVGYLAPVLSLGLGVMLFKQIPGQNALLGALLIIFFGVLLPFLRQRKPGASLFWFSRKK